MELIDLYCDGAPEDRSLDQGASVALPCLRYSARFAAHKKGVGLEKAFRATRSEWGCGSVTEGGVRFRVCESSVGDKIAS